VQVVKSGQFAAHEMIAEVAKEAAGALYDKLMSDNLLRRLWKERWPEVTEKELAKRFVETKWPACVPFARATLALLLQKTDDEDLKEKIMEALVLDRSLPKGVRRVRNGR